MKRGKEQKMNQTSSIISLNLPLHARTPLSLVSGCENFSIASAFRLMMMKNFKFKLNQFLPLNQFSVFHNLIQIPIFQTPHTGCNTDGCLVALCEFTSRRTRGIYSRLGRTSRRYGIGTEFSLYN